MDTDTFDVARYLGIDAATSPTLTPAGGLVFLLDTTGTPQVWTADGPGAWPRRLTGHDERVSFVAASPTREEVVFGMDRGSDERDQLFRYDLETGAEVALTDDPESIHLWGAWSPDGDRIAYAANRREDDTFDVYVQGREETAAAAELVHEGPGGFLSVEAWRPDGEALVVSRAHASFDQDLYRIDLADGTATRLTDDEEASYDSPTYGPDGDLYALTNRGSDATYLGRRNPETGEWDVVAGDRTDADAPAWETDAWNVDAFAVGDDGTLVYGRNVDGYSELYAGRLDGPTDASVERVDAPAGVASELTLGDEGRYAFTFAASGEPYGVYVGDAETTDVERATRQGTLGVPRESFRAPEVVRYETFDGREIPAYWTLPEGVEPSEGDDGPGVPVVVDVHGGPEHQRRPWFYPTKQFYLSRGYAVFEPNVRGSTGYGKAYTHLDDVEKRMDSVADLAAAVEWLRERSAVDGDRIVAYGRSYGGFMVLAAITEYPDLWAAAVDFVGIADFETFLENTGEWRRSHRESEYGSLEDRDLLREISPIHRADRVECPLFVQHGANDPRVPVGEAEQIVEALSERGIPVESLVFEDEGHHTTSRENRIEQFERIADFLDEHVGDEE